MLLLLALALPFTRELSGLNLIALAILFFAYLLYSNKLGVIPKSLLALSAWGLLYAALSFVDVFPQTWTRLFEVAAIPQQALFAYGLPLTFAVMVLYFREQFGTSEGRLSVAKKLVWIWLSWKLLGLISNPSDATFAGLVSIATMGNAPSLIIAAICLYLSVVTSDLKKYVAISIFLILSALSPFSQNLIYAFIFSVIWIFPRKAIAITTGFVVSSVLLYVMFFNDPFALRSLDSNMPIRLILIRDALAGLFQSYGVGVGFGTESITNDYTRLGILHFQSSESAGFIHLSVHNSFTTIPFRLGIVGFLILIWFCVQTFKRIKDSADDRDTQAKCALFLAFFTVTFINPGLESYFYLYGICIYLSTLWAFPQKRIATAPRSFSPACSDGAHRTTPKMTA